MYLAIDIGNTSITIGVVINGRVKKVEQVKSTLTGKLFSLELKKVLLKMKRLGKGPATALICSVVPSLTGIVAQSVKNVCGFEVRVIGKDIAIPIINNYDIPGQVGVDRLIGAYGARELYGAPVIIVDFGTAITIDVVSTKGEYEGGLIIPGIRLSMASLFQKTALLPDVETVHRPKSTIGKNTEDSILSGIFYGYGAMCTHLIHDLKAGRGIKPKIQSLRKAKVILTGGYTEIMKEYIMARVDKIERDLVLKSMVMLDQRADSK